MVFCGAEKTSGEILQILTLTNTISSTVAFKVSCLFLFLLQSTGCPVKKVSIKNFYSDLFTASIHSF